eukprot:PITA_22155
MVDDQLPDEHHFAISVLSPWFADIENYLVPIHFPLNLSSKEKRKIIRKSTPFTRIRGNLLKLGPDQILKRMGKPTPRDEMPLQPQVTFEPFDKWGMDFIGPILGPSKQKQYNIVCTDYPIKWTKTKEIKAAIEEKVAEFLRENVFYKSGYPRELVNDQGNQFTSNMIEDLLIQYKIKHRTSTPYHPQANGQVEVTMRALESIFTKMISRSRKDWADRLVDATWAYNTTWKTTTRFTPYEFVYGERVLLSIEFEYNTVRMATQLDLDLSSAQKERLLQLNGLYEFRMQALLHTKVTQLQRKIWHDKKIKDKQFQEGYWDLLYYSIYEYFKGKLRTIWLGTYVIEIFHDNGSVQIRTIDAEAIPLLVNGHIMKFYMRPLSK